MTSWQCHGEGMHDMRTTIVCVTCMVDNNQMCSISGL